MIPLSKITGKHSSGTQTNYNRRIPWSQIIGTASPQEEPKEDSNGGFWDTAKSLLDFTPAGVAYNVVDSPVPHFAGGLLAETAGNIAEKLAKEFPEDSWRRSALDSASNFAQNITDAALKNAQNKVEVGDDDTFSGAIGNRFVSSASGLLGNTASMIHADKIADAAIEASEATANKNRVSTDDLREYFTNPRGFASDATEQLTSTAMIAPFMALLPEAAVARGVAALGGDAITQGLINRGMYNAAKWFAGGAPRAVQYGLTSAPVEGAMEGGETRRERLNQGASEEEATKESLITMGKNIPLLLATNTLEGLAYFSPLRGANKALQIAGRAAANSAQEQYEEFAQEGIQNAARGEPYSWLPWEGAPEQYEAAERVRYPALFMGGIGGAIQALGTNENQENYERGSQEQISNEDYSKRANLTAKQAEIWDAAQYASARAKEKFGYDIAPELIYKQWGHEAGANFDSENARYNNNFGGLTQSEPNGEENKQPDGNNYYRHFNNVREYADAYVDDFIRYYPEISGAKNEREFASVLKNYGYFGDDLDNYVAGMEGIQTPANRTSGNQPKIDFATGLQSARKALDGKQMENGTVGCVEAVTKILSHVHPEFKKMVEDNVVNTVEGENSLHSRLEKMGVEIIPFDESKVAQGDIIFYDDKQTYQHVLVADYKDADGNWRVFGNSSSNNKVMEQPLYQGQTPSWIAKVSDLQDSNAQSSQKQAQQKQKNNQQEEPSKPLFDLNAEDSTTQKLLEQFANDRFAKAVDEENLEEVNFFNGMFDDTSAFQNTPENRNAVIMRYGDELKEFIQSNTPDEKQAQTQTKPADNKPNIEQSNDPYQKRGALKTAANRFLEQLRAEGDTGKGSTAFKLQNALNNGNFVEAENILRQNGVTIFQPQKTQPSQIQQDPVSKNTTPENILSQPREKSSSNEKLIRRASKSVTPKTSREQKQKVGNAIIQLANQNGVAVTGVDFKSLQNGSSRKIKEWQTKLSQAGLFTTTTPQTQSKPNDSQIIETKDANGTTIFTPEGYAPPLKRRAKPLVERFKAQQQAEREADLANEDDEENKLPDVLPKTESESLTDHEDEKLLKEEDKEGRLREEQRQREEREAWQAKQNKELQELQARQAEAKRLRDEARREEEQKTSQQLNADTSITQEEKESIQEEEQPKPAAGKSRQADESVQEESVQPPEETQQKVQSTQPAKTPQDRMNLAARAPISTKRSERIKQGKAIKAVAKQNDINLSRPLEIALDEGSAKGIEAVQDILQEQAPQVQETETSKSKDIRGNTAEVITGSRTPHKIQYRVVEANGLNSSHVIDNGNVYANESYPSELQPRNRTRADMQTQLISMSNNLNPVDLLDARDVNQGAPVVRNDGVVLNGNGRTAAIRYAYENGKGDDYKNTLLKNAQRLGLDANKISKMNQPILVREVQNDLNESEVRGITSTQTGGARMGASEQAQADAAKLSLGTLSIFPTDDSVDLTHAAATDFLRAAIRDIATPDERNSLTQDNGKISQDGINRAKRALFALAYGDNGLIARMSESTDDNVRGATNALLTAAPTIAKVKAAMSEGRLHSYDLTPITDAVNKLSALRDQGKPVSNYLQEQSLFDEDSAEMKEILTFLDRYKRAPKRITAFLKKIASNIQKQGDPRQEVLFGKNEPAPLIDLITRARDDVANNGQVAPPFSRNGEVNTTIDNFVDEKDLTPQQKLLADYGKKMGARTVFFNNADGNFHGAHSNGTSYFNVNSEKPLGQVFWHESMHWLKNNNADLYGELAKAAGITDAQRDAYLKQTGRADLETDEAIDEEIIADQFEDIAKRSGLLQSIAGKNRGLIERTVQWLKDTMNKFIDHFRNPQGKLTTNQSIALADEFGRIARNLKDADGNKIFRYNSRTHNIELADGNNLESVRSDDEMKYSFAGRKAKTANLETLKQAKAMEKRGADRDEIYNKTGWFKGKDGKWRFEIPDNREQMNLQRLVGNNGENVGKQFLLEHVYDNPELFAAYPKLKTISILSEDLGDEIAGQAHDDKIILNVALVASDLKDAQNTLVHEIQHMIQRYEKFARGGSIARVKQVLNTNQDFIKKAVDKIPNGEQYFKSLIDMVKAVEAGDEEAFDKALNARRKAQEKLSDKAKERLERFAPLFKELDDALAQGNTETERHELYLRLGGEQEARHVEERLDNRNGTPKPHNDDALIVFGGRTYAIAKQFVNKKNAPKNGDGELVERGSKLPPAATANGTTDRKPIEIGVQADNKGGVRPSGANVETNSPKESISQGRQDSNIKYSIGNDNSTESLTQKIKNKLSSWLDGKRPTERRKKRITENLRRLSGHRILYGYVDGLDDIVVDHMQKLIQSRHTYDWEKLLPVVGKEIAKQLNLNPTVEQGNYIADWLLTGALNNTSTEAKSFQKAMRENPAQAELLQETRDLFQEMADMSPEERVRESLVARQNKSFLEKLGLSKGDFEEQIVNDLAGLTKLVDDAVKNSTPEIAEMIKRGCSPDKLAQISRGKGEIADLMVNGKTKNIDELRASLSEQYTGVNFSNFKPLESIFESVGGDWEGLQTFAVAKLTKEICDYNRENPADQITPYISESDADHIIKNGEKKFGQAQKDLVRFSKTLLAIRYDSGLLTDNQYFRISKKWKNYVPMARVFDENEDYHGFDDLKRRKGHRNDTWSPIQTMMANTHKIVQACERNKVKLEIANLVRFGGFDSNLSEVASSNPNVDNIITFYENGKKKYLETPDPSIKRGIDALQSKSEGEWIVKMLRAVTGFMRMFYTGGNVDFAAGNLFRDLPDAYIHNQHLGLTTPITELIDAWRVGFKGAWRAFTGKPLTKEFIDWQMNGGAQAAFVSGDVDYIQRSIDDATSTRLQRYRQKPFTQLLDDFQKFSEFTENVTRLSTYTLAKNRLAKMNPDGLAKLSDKQLAAHASREASIDFSKAGTSTRKVNNYILFANAAVQGIAQWGYAIREAKNGNSKPLFGKAFRAMTQAVLLAALQFAFAHSDDDRKKEYEQAPDWEKETYWIFGGAKVPKGMDFGLRFMANLTDEALSFLWDKKPIEANRFLQTIKNAAPSLTATVITPIVEVNYGKGGYSFFRQAPIVPQREQHLNPEMQYDANTSSVAKLFGQMTGWSPRKLDYLINGYFGFMGRFASHAPNYLERGIGLDEAPMIRRFIFEPYKNPKIVKDYYEAYDEQTSHYNTYKLTKEKPEDYDPALYKRLKAAHETMNKISKLEKRIIDDPKLSYDERKAKLRELEKRRIALCEKVFRRAQ